ncbi:MAG: hypothetical protein GXO82_01375 [Chlorobi bacterium]|nr:hypothetical protein [Chlorobiota bacterium]
MIRKRVMVWWLVMGLVTAIAFIIPAGKLILLVIGWWLAWPILSRGSLVPYVSGSISFSEFKRESNRIIKGLVVFVLAVTVVGVLIITRPDLKPFVPSSTLTNAIVAVQFVVVTVQAVYFWVRQPEWLLRKAKENA